MDHPEVRVRFAPSPTGFLHIGGVRTALFNWLYARGRGGKFILRIEDTDLERSEQRYTDDILASMKWLGLDWDEEPLYQSKRLEIYRDQAEVLVAKGLAYRCTCTEQEVEAMREAASAAGKKPQYDRRCRERNHDASKPHVIRAKIPLDGGVDFLDLIRGTIRVENSEIDDFVLVRSNGAPTYNLSVVIDDVHSRMTHIIRGDDHINNTPKQIHLYRALGYAVPAFAHLPMILGPDKKKLSKRHGAVSANLYRQEGYLPVALLNFLARLGWSHGDQEEFTLAEMIQHFSFDHVQKSSAVFNVEKLNWLNGAHLRKTPAPDLLRIVLSDYKDQFSDEARRTADSNFGVQCVALIAPKVKFLREIPEQLIPLCVKSKPEVTLEAIAGLKWAKHPEIKAPIQAATRELLEDWGESGSHRPTDPQAIDALLRALAEKHAVKLGDLAQPLRLCVTGKLVSAGLFELLVLLPWDVLKPRLERVLTL